MITVTINGKQVKLEKPATILNAAKMAGIKIPTLCHHDLLEPFGDAGYASWKSRRSRDFKLRVLCI